MPRFCNHALLGAGLLLVLGPAWLVAVAAPTPPAKSAEPPASNSKVVKKSFEQLSDLERAADQARDQFWKGRYQEAAAEFGRLADEPHASAPLYRQERAMCHLALGNPEAAAQDLLFAGQFLEAYGDASLEKRAVSSYGRESEKIYFGDPYERAFNFLLLALISMNKGDYDNALAACKSGLLADSDATENRYESDLTLLYLLEAKCHRLRGQSDSAEPVLKAAAESYRITHPKVREVFSERQDQIAIQKLSAKERKELEIRDSDTVIGERIQALDAKLAVAGQAVDANADLGPLLTGKFNTLILVPRGQSPVKTRYGTEAHLIVFTPNKGKGQDAEISVDGQALRAAPLNNLADVLFQATTRGGRRMDAILKGKVAYKNTTVGVGRTMTQTGNAVGGVVGLGFALIGAAVQAAGAAITPEADPRCWKTLPSDYTIYALDLSPGEHIISFDRYVYFEKADTVTRKLNISGPNGFAVVFAPPALMAKYSHAALNDDGERKTRANGTNGIGADSPPLLVPPGLSIGQIERFPAESGSVRPRAIAPDPLRLGRITQQTLSRKGFQAVLLNHNRVVADRRAAAQVGPFSVQAELLGLNVQPGAEGEQFLAEFEFNLVGTKSGDRAANRKIIGRSLKNKKDKSECITHFYQAYTSALEDFLQFSEVASALSSSSVTKTAGDSK